MKIYARITFRAFSCLIERTCGSMPEITCFTSFTFSGQMQFARKQVEFPTRRVATTWPALGFRRSYRLLGFGARRWSALRLRTRIRSRTFHMSELTVFACALTFTPILPARIVRHSLQTVLSSLSTTFGLFRKETQNL